jgi:hypothetical protein
MTPSPGTATQFDQLLRSGLALRSPGFAIELAALKHACAVARRCGNDAPVCQAIAVIPDQPLPSCAAAAACLRRMDRLSCTQDNPDDLLDVVMGATDCATAMGC